MQRHVAHYATTPFVRSLRRRPFAPTIFFSTASKDGQHQVGALASSAKVEGESNGAAGTFSRPVHHAYSADPPTSKAHESLERAVLPKDSDVLGLSSNRDSEAKPGDSLFAFLDPTTVRVVAGIVLHMNELT